MKGLLGLPLIACVLLGAGCAAAPPPALPGSSSLPLPLPDRSLPDSPVDALGAVSRYAAEPLDYRIGAGDGLVITVFEAPELNRTTQVSERGAVSLALIGEVAAAGRTAAELELAIAAELKNYIIDPHVSVEVSEVLSRPISVVGAVRRPGALQLRGPRPLLEVLAMAGGLGEEAGDGVLVIRASALPRDQAEPVGSGSEPALSAAVQQIDLRQLLASHDPQGGAIVYPGDVVRVEEAGIVYVVGEVAQPGGFPMRAGAGLTLLQAVALGEGLRPTAAPGRTLIIRNTPDGQRTELSVDLGDVIAGRVPDPQLEPRDIVYVPNSAAKSVVYGVAGALVRMVTLRGLF